MRHRNKVKKLGKTASHRRAMLRNMLTSFFKHGKITTTEPKAKYAKPFAEKMITKAMKGDLASKRFIISFLQDREVAHNLINDIAYRYSDKATGGYTRVLKMQHRKGDGAMMAVLELVDPEERKKTKKRKTKRVEQPEIKEKAQVAEVAPEPVAEPEVAPESSEEKE